MTRLHNESHFRHALFALQDPDGYVDSLLAMASRQGGPRKAEGRLGASARYDFRLGLNRRRSALN